jgi:hypothetical protein
LVVDLFYSHKMADAVKDFSPLTKNLSIFYKKIFYSAHELGPRLEKLTPESGSQGPKSARSRIRKAFYQLRWMCTVQHK